MQEQQDILIYQTEDGITKIQVRLTDNTVWLTQAAMVELFQSSKSNISEHIKHVFEEGELSRELVVRKFRTTTKHGAVEGKTQENWTSFYNLDVVISVGYRVKSLRGTQFRIWATERLREYLIKGFTINFIQPNGTFRAVRKSGVGDCPRSPKSHKSPEKTITPPAALSFQKTAAAGTFPPC